MSINVDSINTLHSSTLSFASPVVFLQSVTAPAAITQQTFTATMGGIAPFSGVYAIYGDQVVVTFNEFSYTAAGDSTVSASANILPQCADTCGAWGSSFGYVNTADGSSYVGKFRIDPSQRTFTMSSMPGKPEFLDNYVYAIKGGTFSYKLKQ